MDEVRVERLGLQLPDSRWLLRNCAFTLRPGTVTALMGPSGSGKSTLLAWLTGTLAPGIHSSGRVWMGSRELTHLPAEHRRLGLMLQQDYLFPHMSVGDNLLFGLRPSRDSTGAPARRRCRQERRQRMLQSLADAGLGGMENRDPSTLSGGQRARVSLLRTLLSEPQALLLDEPFSGLDADLREHIRQFCWRVAAALPVLLVTHDLEDVPPGASIIRLQDGACDSSGIREVLV